MTKITINIENEPEPEPDYNFDLSEDVIFSVIDNGLEFNQNRRWKRFSIDYIDLMSRPDEKQGIMSYEELYGLIDNVIMDLCDSPEKEGWFVLEGITGRYIKGDGWMTDDDVDFYCDNEMRPATPEEIERYKDVST